MTKLVSSFTQRFPLRAGTARAGLTKVACPATANLSAGHWAVTAFAQGIEAGLDQARDAIMRLLGEARAETHEAWRMRNAALAEEASPTAEAQQ